MSSSLGSLLYRSAATLAVLSLIEACALFRKVGSFLVLFFTVLFFFATWGILALSNWSFLQHDPGGKMRAAVELAFVGQPLFIGFLSEGVPAEPRLGAAKPWLFSLLAKKPSGPALPLIGISGPDARHIGSHSRNTLSATRSSIEDLGPAGDEAFFEKARRQGLLPAAVIHLPSNRLGQALGTLRMGDDFTSAERVAAVDSLKAMLAAIGRDRTLAAGHAEPSRHAIIDGIATAPPKKRLTTPAAEAAAEVASRDKNLRLAFGILSSAAAWMAAATGLFVAKSRSARGEFECFAASPSKAWSMALSLPIGVSLTAAALIALGILAAALLFADAKEFPLALQACSALAIQALAFSCWETLVLSLAIKKRLVGLLAIAPVFYLLNHARMALLDSAGGPSGAISALMSDNWASWSHAASLYAAAAVGAAALAHWRIGPGCRKAWQAKPT